MTPKPRSTAAKKPSAGRKAPAKAKAEPKRQSAATPRSRRKSAARRAPRAAPPAAGSAKLSAIPPEMLDHFGGPERVGLIVADRVPADATPTDVLRLLSKAEQLGADPLAGDVYLARGMARDGGEYEYSVAVKRDALLAYAQRFDDFLGFEANAVYQGDTFELVEPDPSGTLRQRVGIKHTAVIADERPECKRAWCVVERRGKPPVFFIAERSEYLPADLFESLDAEDPRKRYPDRYLVKAALCWPLRMAFSLTDVVGAEEIGAQRSAARPSGPREPEPAEAMPNIDGTDELDQRVIALYEEAHRAFPVEWPPAKIRARLLGSTDREAREALADELRDAIAVRLDELTAFDPTDLEDDALAEYQAERSRLEALLEQPVVAAA